MILHRRAGYTGLVLPVFVLALATAAGEKLVVRELDAQGVAPALAQSLTTVVATELAAAGAGEVMSSADLLSLLDQEQQRQLLGCADAQCASRLAGVADALRLVSGSVAAVGGRFLVSLVLLDTRESEVLRRVAREATSEELLVEAARQAARALVVAEDPASACLGCEPGGDTTVALVVGNSFNDLLAGGLDVSLFGPGVELDFSRRLAERLAVFASAGLTSGKSDEVRFQVLPVGAGARLLFPDLFEGGLLYLGLGVGVGFVRTVLAGEAAVRSSFSGAAAVGAQWALGAGLGLRLEGGYRLTLDTPEALRSHSLGGATVRLGLAYSF